MAFGPTATQERRRFSRSEGPARVQINLLRPQGVIRVDSVNCGEGGLCVRLEEVLDVRSLVRLQVTTARTRSVRRLKPFECTGRVAWVIQRLDLRPLPPFLYEVGIEFVDLPPSLRPLIAQRGMPRSPSKERTGQEKSLEPALIRGRSFIPRLALESNRPTRWHLIVSVDGVPCFSSRYASERSAKTAWMQFQRQQAKR